MTTAQSHSAGASAFRLRAEARPYTGRNLHVSTAVEPAIAAADMVVLSVNTPTKARGIGAGDGRARRHQANPTQTG